MELAFIVNGRSRRIDLPGDATLLHALREVLHLTGTKEACNEGECGACTVLLDGRPIDSCIFPAHAAAGRSITTVEGLTEPGGGLTTIQQSLVERFAIQCGFCTPGFVMTLTALLDRNPSPTEAEVRDAVAGNLCRCTGYSTIIDAVMEGGFR